MRLTVSDAFIRKLEWFIVVLIFTEYYARRNHQICIYNSSSYHCTFAAQKRNVQKSGAAARR
jgi:hypothetical protein